MASTQFVISSSAGTITSDITPASFTSTVTTAVGGIQGSFLDFGATRAKNWLARLQMKPNAANPPVAGGTVELYMAFEDVTTASGAGGVSGSVGAYTGPDGVATSGVNQLVSIGYFNACTTTSSQTQDLGVFMPMRRYGAPVLITRLGTAFHADSTSHSLTFIPIKDITA